MELLLSITEAWSKCLRLEVDQVSEALQNDIDLLKELVEQNDGEKDDDLGFEGWWLSTLETSKAVEENEPLIGVGKIIR